ncbi:hypothetical protein M408DRAFT_325682 [Serendipita vermifera MAFF 305830]|uniref:Uncharacterized protein n=1 Tax=Serendipita vermifera MAFF 305830 TaxID=933852 RepID=A0A0C2XZD4_SERVB|nr:hypothetical protein M408DRAFT_325682 [Serendipita vermifera MAFF 305830]
MTTDWSVSKKVSGWQERQNRGPLCKRQARGEKGGEKNKRVPERKTGWYEENGGSGLTRRDLGGEETEKTENDGRRETGM